MFKSTRRTYVVGIVVKDDHKSQLMGKEGQGGNGKIC